ncbi:MAG: hypothetical protein QG599_711 [Pseudomonadota bacterium]|nr:hypothetical protein [Pseudomonadota bacterium]
MDTQMMVWMASAGAFAGMVSVIIALLAGMRYSAHLRRMPAATALENVAERLKNGREELERVEAESEKQRGQRDALKAELSVIIAHRDATNAESEDLKNELIALEGRKAEILKVRDELTELRIQQADLLRDLVERRTQYSELVIAAERAQAQIALFDERKAEIEALAITEHEARTRLTEARGELEYTNRQLVVARVETERFTADREKALAETQRIEDKKIQLQQELAQLQEAHEPLADKLEKTRQELETTHQELRANRQKGQELEDELAHWRTVRGATEVATETARAELIKLQAELEPARQDQALAVLQLQSIQHQLAENENYLRKQAEDIARLNTICVSNEAVLATKRAEIESLQAELLRLQEQSDPLATELDKTREELETVCQDLKTTRQQRQELDDELANLRFVRASIEATTATTKAELESVQIELENLQQLEGERERAYQELEGARQELTTVRHQSQEHQEELANLRALRANIEAAITTNRETVETVQAELEELQEKREPLSAELENIRREIITGRERQQELENEVTGLYATRAVIESEVAKARKDLAGTQPGDPLPVDEKIANLLSPPACLVEQRDGQQIAVLPHAQHKVTEAEALDKVLEHMEKLGLYFPKRTLYAFHTALKTAAISPLTVLAGISGTGKSQLPRRYAEAMGIHFLKIPVQPRWDSPQDMLGFYNYLEGRYKATELARALVHFDPYHWPDLAEKYQDRLMLVLLDEMNLARVEYYFSEFLSQLEGRPEPGNINPDHIRNSTIILDIGSSESRRIYPGHNLLFVGTMNEDESTQTLSDKVLDRANLLRFSRPAKLMDKPLRDEAGCPATGYLSAKVWHQWQRDTIDPSIGNSIGEWIKELNDALDGLGRPFAHRVNQAILAYVANYPVIHSKTESAQFAFADLLAQRILPKLRGIELDNEILRPHLDRIKDLISNKLNDQQLADAFNKAVRDDGSGRPFVWMGVRRDEK